MSEWQPIETVPKDGTHVLALFDGGVIEAWYEKDDYWGDWDTITLPLHGCGCCGERNDPPTHWMPLPEPPK